MKKLIQSAKLCTKYKCIEILYNLFNKMFQFNFEILIKPSELK